MVWNLHGGPKPTLSRSIDADLMQTWDGDGDLACNGLAASLMLKLGSSWQQLAAAVAVLAPLCLECSVL